MEHETDSKTESPIFQVGYPISISEFIKQVEVKDFSSKLQKQFLSFWKRGKEFLFYASNSWKRAGWYPSLDFLECLWLFRFGDLKSLPARYLEKKSRAIEPIYLYTTEKGYFLLPEVAKSYHNIQTVNITISAQSSCFGNRHDFFNGIDSYIIAIFLSQLVDLKYVVTKCGVLITSLFVFFTTTMSVSFTLRETQSRMLRFTVQLQHHARNHLLTFQLIFVHVIESLVFVPIMIGILFFVFEFYDDQLLAILVLTRVWLLFTMMRFFLCGFFRNCSIYVTLDSLLLEPIRGPCPTKIHENSRSAAATNWCSDHIICYLHLHVSHCKSN